MPDAPTPTIALTGAGGTIGMVLRPRLAALAATLRSIDTEPITDPAPNEERVSVDIRDRDAVAMALDGCDAVVHLAAIPTEAPFDDIVEVNVTGTYNVFEGAREGGVRRVVYASSIHANGFTPLGDPGDPRLAPRPDTLYGWSKVAGEALGRLYNDKFGLEVVCLRIIGFADEPRKPTYLWGWLSHRDAVQLVERALLAPEIDFLIVYGVSANSRRPVTDTGWDVLGYEPVDDAEAFVARVGEPESPPAHQGMEFTSWELP